MLVGSHRGSLPRSCWAWRRSLEFLEGGGGLGKAPAALQESSQGLNAPIEAQKDAARETGEQPSFAARGSSPGQTDRRGKPGLRRQA